MVRLVGRNVMRGTEPPAHPGTCPQVPCPGYQRCVRKKEILCRCGATLPSARDLARQMEKDKRFKKNNTGTLPGTKGPAWNRKNPE